MNKHTKKTETKQGSLFQKYLRQEVWKKAIGNNSISKGNHYYEQISTTILRETNYSLSKDTIRNFLEQKHTPNPKTLDIYSTFVLNGSEDNPKTFTDFQNWYSSKATYFNLSDYFKKDKNRYFILIGGIGVIIFLVILVLARQPKPVSPEIILSTPNAFSSPQISILEQQMPTEDIIQTLFNDFTFDKNEQVNKVEAIKILEWLGVRKIEYNKHGIEPSYSGSLKNGCLVSILIGFKEAEDTYGLHCNCKKADPNFQSYYLEIIKPKETHPLTKRFYNSSLEDLKKDRWFLFSDSINLDLWNNPKYKSNGFLTLETYLGDSFLDTREHDPRVINILAKDISCGDCCEITVKLVDFNPYQRYQQAGFFIFYTDIPYPSLRMTLSNNGKVTVIKRDAKYSNKHLIISPKHAERASAYSVTNEKIITPLDSIVLKLRIEKDQYFFSHKANNNKEFIDIKSQVLDFPIPKYIGLTAFQGRPEIPFPVHPVADTIPAYFEYVRLKPCSE